MNQTTHACPDCGTDISHRRWNAKRCQQCTARRSRANRGKPAVLIARECATCGSPFIAKRSDSTCCSRACTVARLNAIHNAARRVRHAPRPCPLCGDQFVPQRSDSTACSASCARRLAYVPRDVRHDKICDVCGKAFTSKRSDAKRCSPRCGKIHHYAENRDALIAAAAAWSTANRDKRRLIAAQYKAKRRGWEGDGPGVALKDWLQVLGRHAGRCAYCGGETCDTHMDHVVPLSRGGAHSIGNVLPACPACNLSKGPKLLVEWRRR
ncbi:HNH endonuclease [Streptomyces asiaticus]